MGLDRVHLFISGRVQGVWYRASMSNEGARIGLNGWVRNLDDSRVEAVVEGSGDDIQEMIAWCRKGPPMARVDDIAVEDETATGNEPPFRARY